MRVLILATDIYTRGGIARYTDTLATSLGKLLGAANVDLLPIFDDPERSFTPARYRILQATTKRLTFSKKVQHATRVLVRAALQYDLVFCSHISLAPLAALGHACYQTPYLVVCYGSEVWDRLSLVKRAALKGSRLVLCDSQFTARVVAEVNGISATKIGLLLNAIPDDLVSRLVGSDRSQSCHSRHDDEDLSQRLLSLRMPEDKCWTAHMNGPVLLSVGSLNKEHAYKGVDTVIEALPSIQKAVPAVRYVVVGDGDNRQDLERSARRRGISGAVIFRGEVPDADLADLYRGCDLFVLPSRAAQRYKVGHGVTEGEGFGRVYVEAALAGKPVVGSRDGGAAEAVIDGRTGLLVNPRSVEEVAGAVIGLLKTPERAAAMGSEGRRWALETFTVKAMCSQLERILGMISTSASAGRRSPRFAFGSAAADSSLVSGTKDLTSGTT